MSSQPVQSSSTPAALALGEMEAGMKADAQAALQQTKGRRYTQLMLLVLAAGAIYPILYLRQVYQPTMLEVFHITDKIGRAHV